MDTFVSFVLLFFSFQTNSVRFYIKMLFVSEVTQHYYNITTILDNVELKKNKMHWRIISATLDITLMFHENSLTRIYFFHVINSFLVKIYGWCSRCVCSFSIVACTIQGTLTECTYQSIGAHRNILINPYIHIRFSQAIAIFRNVRTEGKNPIHNVRVCMWHAINQAKLENFHTANIHW